MRETREITINLDTKKCENNWYRQSSLRRRLDSMGEEKKKKYTFDQIFSF